MLEITIPESEFYDERSERFVSIRAQTLQLEHSLVSISKWEAKWHKPFLGKDQKTEEETRDYVRCMTINRNVDPIYYMALTRANIIEINRYLEDTMTATWFNERDNKRFNKEVITSELIYYWMVSLEIPFECEKWHINRLLTLIRICNIKNAGDKRMSKKDILNSNRMLNAARRQKLHSNG